jgi:hypothetical protein
LPPTTAAASATRSTATAHSAATTAAAASGRRTTAAPTLPTTATYTPRRTLSDSAPKTPAETEEQSESLGARPNEDVLPHVSEEAAAIGRIISGGRGAAKGDEYEGEGGREGGGGDGGELGPDLGQGTPVQEVRIFGLMPYLFSCFATSPPLHFHLTHFSLFLAVWRDILA